MYVCMHECMNAYSKHHVEYLNLFDSVSYVNTLTISISIEDCHGNCTDIQQQKNIFRIQQRTHLILRQSSGSAVIALGNQVPFSQLLELRASVHCRIRPGLDQDWMGRRKRQGLG